MADYTVLQSSDPDAAANFGVTVGQSNLADHREFGLDVPEGSVDWANGAFDTTEGKVHVLVDTATASWQDDSGTNQTEARHRVLYTAHYDARSGVSFDASGSVVYIYADLNLGHDDQPLIATNTTGTAPTDESIEIARLDTAAQTVEPRNGNPDATFGTLEATDAFTDPSGRLHQNEMAAASDVRTDSEIEGLAQGRVDAHDHYEDQDAVAAVNTEDTLDVGVSGTAGGVAGQDVSGQVAEAQHADTATNATQAGGVDPSNFLRVDTRDKLNADVDANDQRIENLDGLAFSDSSAAAIDLSDSPDGDRVVVAHEDHQWESRSGSGEPFAVRGETGGGVGDIIAVDGGNFYVHRGDVFTEDGRLASQQWVNQNTVSSGGDSMGGPLDMDGNAVVGVSGVQAAGSQIDIHDRTNIHAPLEENGERVATRQWAYSNVSLGAHTHDGRYYREAETYSTGQADGRFAGSGHNHDGRYARAGDVYTTGETYSQSQADARFVNEGETIDMAGNDVQDAFNVWANNFVFNQQHGNSGPSNLYVDGDGSLLFSPPSTNDTFRIYDNR